MDPLAGDLKDLENEEDRLKCLYSYQLLDTEVDNELEVLNHLAATICGTPVSLIVLLDKNRQWFKSHFGWERSETERIFSFCHYTILENKDILEVENTLNDPRFKNNPLVIQDPFIRYYCGTPLINPEGYKLGSLCVIDNKERKLLGSQKEALVLLGKQVVAHFELHRQKLFLDAQKRILEKEVNQRSKELLEINNELQTFLYRTSHDIRGPIATIISLSHISQEINDDEEVQFYLRNISDTGLKLDDVLQNLLKVMRLKDSNLYFSELNAIKLEKLILKIIERDKNKNIEFILNIDYNIKLAIDEDILSIILSNLINNSVNYSHNEKDRSYIKITVQEEQGNLVKFMVEDNGFGIKEEIYNRIYEMFFRGTNNSKGAGLGLYIVKKAVEKLNGQIYFSSVPDKVTRFTVVLKKHLSHNKGV